MYHNGNDWVTTTDPYMIDELYNRKRDFIEEYIDDYTDGLTQADMTRLQRWLDVEEWELYDRIKDPQEMKNVYHNSAYAATVTKLKKELKELRIKYKDSPELDKKYIDIYNNK